MELLDNSKRLSKEISLAARNGTSVDDPEETKFEFMAASNGNSVNDPEETKF